MNYKNFKLIEHKGDIDMEYKIREYEEKMGEFTMPEGAIERLSGLPIEEQAKLFRADMGRYQLEIEKASDIEELIVKDGIIIGAMVSDWSNYPTPCFINKSVCTWDAEDNNGAGYKTRTEYLWFEYIG